MKDLKENDAWRELKKKLKNKFMSLSDEDLQYDENRREEMMVNLQIRLGKTRQQLKDLIESL